MGYLPMMRDEAQGIAKHLMDARIVRIAQARRRLDQRVKHPLQIEGRPADDLQNLGGGRLLLQRFRELPCALGQFACLRLFPFK